MSEPERIVFRFGQKIEVRGERVRSESRLRLHLTTLEYSSLRCQG